MSGVHIDKHVTFQRSFVIAQKKEAADFSDKREDFPSHDSSHVRAARSILALARQCFGIRMQDA